ncbi:MAG: hypothetical protein ABH844_00715 [Candidatus Omnitrophota bacterium]
MVIKSKMRKFVVIGQLDKKHKLKTLVVEAENRDIACHLAEIKYGWGTFIACEADYANSIAEDIKKTSLKTGAR